MIRAGCQNHESVTVIVEPGDYETVLAEMTAIMGLHLATRKSLAQKGLCPHRGL